VELEMYRDTAATVNGAEIALQVYLLGEVDFEAGLRFQRRLHYEISGDRSRAALVLCEHPPLITVGRQGSRAHIRAEPEELRARQWRVRWVNRGGGTWLHVPGQLAVYPVLPLDQLGLGLEEYLQRLYGVIIDVLADFSITGVARESHPGICVGSRWIAPVGVAVRDWISYFGFCLNINPPLFPFRLVRSGPGEEPATSLERERHGRLRPALVRQLLIEQFGKRFAFARTAFFSNHPSLEGSAQRCRDIERNGQHARPAGESSSLRGSEGT
jgi:lipoyl(octanoyl) transferase